MTRQDAEREIALWGVPFVLIGLYLIAGRFFLDARNRSRTAYGVTDRRAVFITGLLSRNAKTLVLKTVVDLTLTERADGTGTIEFGPTHPMRRWYGGAWWPGTGDYMGPCFELIPRAKEVFATIRQVQAKG